MVSAVSLNHISDDEMAIRRSAVERARAANYRQGYTSDSVLEEANDRYIHGLISLAELEREMLDAIRAGR